MRLGFLFAGQGAQFVGMGRELCAAFPEARAVLDEAAEACALDLAALAFDGPAERLGETERTQPAILAVSLAVHAVLVSRGVVPHAAAGLSLGEYGALVAAGAAQARDFVPLVRRRGRYMQEAVALGVGGMAAVSGLGDEAVAALCAAAVEALVSSGASAPPGGWVLAAANFNCPGQTVISGHGEAVREAVRLGPGFGARRVVPLAVSAPFHSPLMRPAALRLAADLAAVPLRSASLPVVANVDAEPRQHPDAIRAALVAQVEGAVRFEACVRRLAVLGCEAFVEVGPGRVLAGFVARILPGVRTLSVCDPAGVARCVQEFGSA